MTDITDFAALDLPEPLALAIAAMGYEKPSPIQARAIPHALEGRDLMGIAQTGTGKTAAFALPVLAHILRDAKEAPKRSTRALVLAPTRELAGQIAQSFRDYARHIDGFSVTAVFGGVPLPGQIKKLVPGMDVLVATPGRLIDLLDRKAITLSGVEMLVLDEADQMMDMGFIHALRRIVTFLPKQPRQTLFFSATMAKNIEKLAGQYLKNPVKVSVTPPNSTAEKVSQSVIFVNKSEKLGLLALTVLDEDMKSALVFTRTKHGANKLVKKLTQMGIGSLAIHGNKSQNQRQRALEAFRSGKINVLIATDVAARGIDIEGISHVINYEIPNVAEQYVHRIGRTARAGSSGHAVAFVDSEEKAYLKDIQKLLKTTIPVETLPDDFVGKVRALAKRPGLKEPVLPDEGKPDARKGRGKSRKKARRKPQDGKGAADSKVQGRGPKKQGDRAEAGSRNQNSSQGKGNDKGANNGERRRVTAKKPSNNNSVNRPSNDSGEARPSSGGANRSAGAQKSNWRNSASRRPAPARK